ncbi:MAG: ATP-binding protein [Patescibacteria group bacterium]|nr:ATP-binding protein [Patescibacteria group bacterium]
MSIFEFTFNPYALLSLSAALIDSVLVYLLVARGSQDSANRWFAMMVLFLVPWGIGEGLSRFSANPEGSVFWASLTIMGWLFAPSILLGFALVYIGSEKFLNSFTFRVLLFGPSFIFLFLNFTTDLFYSLDPAKTVKSFYGWNDPVGPLYWLLMGWMDAVLTISVWFLIKYRRKVKDTEKRKQVSILIFATLIPIVGGSITSGILPIFHINVLPSAVLFTSIAAIIITYAMLKYKLFAINPATVVTNIVDTMNEVLIVLNQNHYIDFANNAVEAVLGYKKENLVGQNLKILLGTNWETFYEEVLKPAREGKKIGGVEINLLSSQGEEIPISLSVSPLKSSKGEFWGLVCVATDIRELRELLDVAAERDKLTTTVNSINEAVLTLDLEGRVIMANPATWTLLGMEEKDVLNKKLSEFLIISENKEYLSVEKLTPLGAPKKTVIQKNGLDIYTKSEKKAYVNLTISTIKSGKQTGLGAIVTLQDLSKEKELEEMKLDFVTIAAHELRTPLTSIKGYLSMLGESHQKFNNKEKMFLNRMIVSTDQLSALIENLLSVSRIERGEVTLNIKPVNWVENIKEVIENFKNQALERKINLVFINPQKPIPLIFVDKLRVNEVLSNLLANAVTYTNPGGTNKIWVESNDKEVISHISDTGQGIPKEALPHLFTKFFRVSRKLEQGSKGTGLGLYISKSIVEFHHGKIWVESELGKGSTFSFSLPLKAVKQKEGQTDALR